MLFFVSGFRFAIHQVIGELPGFPDPVVAGQVLTPDATLYVGDWLEIQAPAQRLRVQCTGFPLIRLQHRDWSCITISGLPQGIDLTGLIAEPGSTD